MIAGMAALVQAVQTNCDIADARHAREVSLCTYLLGMREFFRWEHQLPYGASPPRDEVGRWITEREARWEQIADADFVAVPVAGHDFDAFDERWRQVARFRESDTSPKEEFVPHAAGDSGFGGSSAASVSGAGCVIFTGIAASCGTTARPTCGTFRVARVDHAASMSAGESLFFSHSDGDCPWPATNQLIRARLLSVVRMFLPILLVYGPTTR